MLDPEILAQLDRFDPIQAKPANIKRYIQTQFGKEISYAQLAYEMSKRKKGFQTTSVSAATASSFLELAASKIEQEVESAVSEIVRETSTEKIGVKKEGDKLRK